MNFKKVSILGLTSLMAISSIGALNQVSNLKAASNFSISAPTGFRANGDGSEIRLADQSLYQNNNITGLNIDSIYQQDFINDKGEHKVVYSFDYGFVLKSADKSTAHYLQLEEGGDLINNDNPLNQADNNKIEELKNKLDHLENSFYNDKENFANESHSLANEFYKEMSKDGGYIDPLLKDLVESPLNGGFINKNSLVDVSSTLLDQQKLTGDLYDSLLKQELQLSKKINQLKDSGKITEAQAKVLLNSVL